MKLMNHGANRSLCAIPGIIYFDFLPELQKTYTIVGVLFNWVAADKI